MDKCEAIARMAARDNLNKVNRRSAPVYPRKSFYVDHVKRWIDLAVAVPLFVFLLPVNAVIGIITYFDVGRPIFFRQTRTGKGGRHFDIIKFRNMTNATDDAGQLLPPNERVTRFGRFIRKYSLDELLNFWHVIRGDMSLIGPRPLPSEFDERFSDRHRMRTTVRPGLECPSIQKKQGVRLYQEQFENDIWYVEHVSFPVDVKMVLALIRMVFNVSERADHAVVGGGNFVGYDENGIAFSMRRIPEKYEREYQRIAENAKAETER